MSRSPIEGAAARRRRFGIGSGFGVITEPQARMLARLDDGPDAESVGLEVEEMNVHEIGVCERLVGRDLARFDVGWRYSCWFRLTPAGRTALGHLRAAGPFNRSASPGGSRRDAAARRSAPTPRLHATRTERDGQA